MTKQAALAAAKKIAADRATVSAHQGETRKDRAIRISGTWPEPAAEVGREIADAIGGTLRASAGSVLVWF